MLKKLATLVLLAYASLSLNNAYAAFTCDKDNKVDLSDDKVCCCSADTNSSDPGDYKCEPTAAVIGSDGSKKCPTGKTKISNQEKSCLCHFKINR